MNAPFRNAISETSWRKTYRAQNRLEFLPRRTIIRSPRHLAPNARLRHVSGGFGALVA
jgi:hypothetical protein